MLTRAAFPQSVPPPCTISLVFLMFVIDSFATLVGCTGEGGDNSVISSSSTPGDVKISPSLDRATGQTDAMTDFTSGSPSSEGLPSGSNSPENAPLITVTSTPSGVAVQLNWQHSSDANGYRVYYGTHPAQEAGSCADYEANQAVDAPPAMIAGLEHDTIYYFAVKHFNDSDDACSEEIMVVTPPAER